MPYECATCHWVFPSSAGLTAHSLLAAAEDTTPLPCAICGKKFCTRKDLNRHEKRHYRSPSTEGRNTDRQHECDLCDKIFSVSYGLRIHRLTHTGERPYPCKVCGKAFYQSQALKRHHNDVHEGKKSFICPHCGRGFAQKVAMNDHIKTHTGERPFKCEFCGKGFIQRSNMKAHRSRCNKVA